MDVRELVDAVIAGDLVTARQWVADAYRARIRWEDLRCPTELSDENAAVAAGLVELLATRAGVQPPSWTTSVGAIPNEIVLDPGLDQMPRSFAYARAAGPEPLRKRNLVALPDFLDVA